jgi:DNA-binding phage protein
MNGSFEIWESPPPSSAGTDTNRREHDMALTRDYKETVLARIRSDRKFARLFFAGAIEMLLEGETAEALSRLRDLVHAEITFKELARQTGLGEKTLHRMLNRDGNPTARNLGVIVRSIAADLGIKPRVEVAACR